MNVRPGYVRLRCDDPPLDAVVLLGPEAVRVTAGFGGWEVTARPRMVGMTTWEGSEPIQVALSLMFDGFARRKSQETVLGNLFAVARGDAESAPGLLTVQGVMLPPVARWIIESIDYGDPILDPRRMVRLRQPLTLTLREYVPPTYLSIRRRALQGTKGKTRVVTLRKGDTPAKVAARAGCKWTEVRELNPTLVKKANQALKAGTKLRVPVAVTKTAKPKRSGRA
jgi:hypothetical protein